MAGRIRRAACAGAASAALLVGAWLPAAAAVAGPPYDDVRLETAERPDAAGHGTAEADATADAAGGALSVVAGATEDLAAGTIVPALGVPVGHSSAESSARIYHVVDVPAGTGERTITVRAVIDGIDAQATAQRSLVHTGFTNAQASVNASLEVWLDRCPDVFCYAEMRRQEAAPVALSGKTETATAVTLEITMTTSLEGTLQLRIDAGLFALAGAWGNGVAHATAAGTVSLIDVAVA